MTASLSGCFNSPSQDLSAQIVKSLAPSTVVLEYSGGKIRAGELEEAVRPELERMRDEAARLYRAAAAKKVLEASLAVAAKRAGFVDTDAFMTAEKAKIEVDDGAVASYLAKNRLPESSSREIKSFLKEQNWLSKKIEIQNLALAEAQLTWHLPLAQRKISGVLEGFSEGPVAARIQIHEFCDRTNPVCGPLERGIDRIAASQTVKVRRTYHPLYSPKNPVSLRLAQHTVCASQQGHYLEFAQKVKALSQTLAGLSPDQLSAALGLKADEVSTCAVASAGVLEVERKLALNSGVLTGSAVFVNGDLAQNLDEVDLLVRQKNASE
ncbi:MAG: thioredoxin domain-containing protein [Methylotenera sp.]|nr:thioredoxin domain-containing protein [Oligoflexia bacterium]